MTKTSVLKDQLGVSHLVGDNPRSFCQKNVPLVELLLTFKPKSMKKVGANKLWTQVRPDDVHPAGRIEGGSITEENLQQLGWFNCLLLDLKFRCRMVTRFFVWEFDSTCRTFSMVFTNPSDKPEYESSSKKHSLSSSLFRETVREKCTVFVWWPFKHLLWRIRYKRLYYNDVEEEKHFIITEEDDRVWNQFKLLRPFWHNMDDCGRRTIWGHESLSWR